MGSFIAFLVCMLQCVAVCCSVLHCVAVCCSVLQCVCCRVLQCVAVYFEFAGVRCGCERVCGDKTHLYSTCDMM